MNLKKIRKQVGKIKQIVDVLDEHESLSEIEQDLLLDYIRSLYALIKLGDENDTTESIAKLSSNGNQRTPEPEKQFNAPLPDPPKVEITAAAVTPESASPASNEVIEESPEVNNIEVPEEIRQLFELDEAKELSDKLRARKISDLTKAFSINERIFTINELFNGDHVEFDRCVGKLNSFSSFDDAATYLMEEVATSNDWAEYEKSKKAKKFIELVQRRYN